LQVSLGFGKNRTSGKSENKQILRSPPHKNLSYKEEEGTTSGGFIGRKDFEKKILKEIYTNAMKETGKQNLDTKGGAS